MILYVTAALGLTTITKNSETGAIHFNSASGVSEAYTGEFQIVADQGSYIEVFGDIDVVAENGSHVSGYCGSRIQARLGALVTAEEGCYVVAEYGAFVTAYDGSRVEALYGSQIKARCGSYVVAQEGALVDQFSGCKGCGLCWQHHLVDRHFQVDHPDGTLVLSRIKQMSPPTKSACGLICLRQIFRLSFYYFLSHSVELDAVRATLSCP